MPDSCEPIRARIANLEKALQGSDRRGSVELPDVPFARHEDPVELENWKDIKKELKAAKEALAACERALPPPTQIPLRLSCQKIQCLDQDDTNLGVIVDLEDDEPYILVFAVDLQRPDNSKVTKIGPIGGVDEGAGNQFYYLPPNTIWGLSNSPQVISSARNFICLAALIENDDANTDTVRYATETALQVTLAKNITSYLSSQLSRDELVSRLLSDMNGAIPIASAAVPGPDDLIGSAQEVRFTDDDLASIYRTKQEIVKVFYFGSSDATYNAWFTLSV